MAELFRLETDSVAFTLSGPEPPAESAGERASGYLSITPRKPGIQLQPSSTRFGIPNLVAGDLGERAGPRLFEETTYTVLVEGTAGRGVELRHRDPLLLRGLDSSSDGTKQYGSINFRSQVGLTRFSIFAEGRPAFDVEVEVFPSKLDYRADYGIMMGDVQDLAAGLALEYIRATHQLSGASAAQESSRLGWIALLRHVVDDLEAGINQIVRRPSKALTRDPQLVRAEAIRRSDSSVRKAIRGGRGRGARITLRNGIPVRRHIPERRARTTLDTPEHQWLASQLQRVRRTLAKTAADEETRQRQLVQDGRASSARDRVALEELISLETRIARMERVEPLFSATGRPPPGFTSLQLQNAPGYREAYRALLMLRLGLRISGGPLELSVKDVHVLYEYWCFLGIIRLISEILEAPIPPEAILEVRSDGLRIRLQQGRAQTVPFELGGGRTLQVTYNPSFSDPDAILSQRPDIVLTLSDPHWPSVRLVLDAKYRVEDDQAFIERFGVAGPPSDAVNVLHRYRDAILESDEGPPEDSGVGRRRSVIEGAALYPLNAERAKSFDGSKFWISLTRLGIGALPFLPDSRGWLEKWLRAVLQRTGWEVADGLISHSAEERQARWKAAAETSVLVGVLRGSGSDQHLEWIRENRLYYTRHTEQARQLQVGQVAIYEPANMIRPTRGRIRLTARVEEIDVLRRSKIDTPWLPRRGGEDLQVVYKLGEFRELEVPVVNRVGQRFSVNRWSSGLALERADEITQLLLESMAEWRLHDALIAREIHFELRALSPRPHVAAAGRVRFTIGDLQAIWLSGEDFELYVDGHTSVVLLHRLVEILSTSRGAGGGKRI